MHRSVYVDNDWIRGESLRAVRRDGVTMVEMPHFVGAKCQAPGLIAIPADGPVIAVDTFYCAQIAILEVHVGLADGEL